MKCKYSYESLWEELERKIIRMNDEKTQKLEDEISYMNTILKQCNIARLRRKSLLIAFEMMDDIHIKAQEIKNDKKRRK